ncbi:TadE/TadG family type IV pilus assembly protein [Pengzhenrongella sp.]|jgi:Flp pilus assembly protein TadG|uniref:TadE/TadG family type IV pilus assembly protein n=1 Tax=Pengzhenrongella sp. TaxID=2888820 RepID=UPI002F92F5E6
MNRLRHRLGDDERGSATIEIVILTPAVLLLLGLIIFAGRLQIAAGAVEYAAASAAREASLARTPDGARTAATAAGTDSLRNQDLRCVTRSVVLDVSGFARPVGQPAQVTATVTCTVAFDDLAIPGLPGSKTLTAQASSALDRYRS